MVELKAQKQIKSVDKTLANSIFEESQCRLFLPFKAAAFSKGHLIFEN
jgi:hypothetical protein